MLLLPKTKRAAERLAHVRGHLSLRFSKEKLSKWEEKLLDTTLDLDRGEILALFRNSCLVKAMLGWFSMGDAGAIRNLFYNMGKLAYIGLAEGWTDISYRRYTYTNVMDCMPIIVCDHPDLIQWCINSNYGFEEGKNRDKPHSYEYRVKNLFLAMRKEWAELEHRSRQYIASPRPNPYSWLNKFEFDYYLALATGDVPKMEAAISEFVTPKGLRANGSLETGYTDGLISTSGILFAKLAWCSGYEVKIDSPYIPKEWLPVQPLEHYEDEFDFMKAYTIDPTWGGKFV